jgi:hypothetical protein
LSELDERQLANLLVLHFGARRIYDHEICGRCHAIQGDPLPPLRWETDVTAEIGLASTRTGGSTEYLCPRCWWVHSAQLGGGRRVSDVDVAKREEATPIAQVRDMAPSRCCSAWRCKR